MTPNLKLSGVGNTILSKNMVIYLNVKLVGENSTMSEKDPQVVRWLEFGVP